MSGPKVVRIVTLEEVQAICRRLMAQVDGGGEALRRLAKHLGLPDADLDASLARRAARLQEMYAAGRWMEVQKLASNTLAFYPAERERLVAQAAAAAEAVRSRRRRLAEAARTVAEALRASGKPVPASLAECISRAVSAPEADLRELEHQVSLALSGVAGTADPANEASAAAADFAGRLSARQEATSFVGWLAKRVPVPTATETRLDKLAAEIDALDPEEGRRFSTRIAAVLAEDSSSRRALLSDSLVLDLSARVTELRRSQVSAAALREAGAALAVVTGDAAAGLRARIEAALDSGAMREADALAEQALALVEAEEKAVAAAARRGAVLRALSTLGYEVRETMEQTWLRDGRVVLRKPGIQDYGVELGAPPDMARLQVRLVGSDRPSQPRTAARDADQETSWCGDFDRLKALMAVEGGEIVLERALPVGSQPVHALRFRCSRKSNTVHRTVAPSFAKLIEAGCLGQA